MTRGQPWKGTDVWKFGMQKQNTPHLRDVRSWVLAPLCRLCVFPFLWPCFSCRSSVFLIRFTAEKWQAGQESELQETAHHLHPCASLQFWNLIEEDWEGRQQGTYGCHRLLFWARLVRCEGINWSVYASSLPRRAGERSELEAGGSFDPSQ